MAIAVLKVILPMVLLLHGSWCRPDRFYCREDNTTVAATINLSECQGGHKNICPIVRDEEHSLKARHCHWEIHVSGFSGPAHLVTETFLADKLAENIPLDTANNKQAEFRNLLRIMVHANGSQQQVQWNNALLYQLIPVHDSSDYVEIRLHLNTRREVSLGNQIYLQLRYSTKENCSRGFVKLNSTCLKVRNTDKVAQKVAAFDSLFALMNFLDAYERLVATGDMGGEWYNTSKPLRLPMTFFRCSKDELVVQHLVGCNNGSGRFHQWKISPDRLQDGSGDCLSVWRDSSTGNLIFRPVSCIGRMPTVVGFPAAPDQASAKRDGKDGSDYGAAFRNCGAEVLPRIHHCNLDGKSAGVHWMEPIGVTLALLILILILMFIVSLIFKFCRRNTSESEPEEGNRML